MKNNLIIAVIGGGAIFTPELIHYFAENTDAMGSMELRLMDIDEERLNIVGNMCKRIIKKTNSPIVISYCKTYEEVLQDANYILIQFRVGGEDARILDEKLGLKHKIPFVETVSVCGFSAFLRTYYEIEKIAKAVLELAPNSWVLNFTNPAGILSEALNKLGIKKVIGVCNGSTSFIEYAKKKLGTDNLFINWRGLNHFTFTDVMSVSGENVLDKFINSLDDDYIPFSKQILKNLGFIPSNYLQYYFLRSEIVDKQQKLEKVRSEVVKDINKELIDSYRTLDNVPEELKKRGGYGYSRSVVNLIRGIETGDNSIQYAMVKNGNTLIELPADAYVEVPIVALKNDVRTLQVEPLPDSVKGITISMKLYEQMLIKAAKQRSKKLMLTSLLMHPLIGDWKLAQLVFEDVLRENASYLPDLN